MKDFLAVVGVVLLVACCWVGLVTMRSGGVRQTGPDGEVVAVVWIAADQAGRGSAVQGEQPPAGRAESALGYTLSEAEGAASATKPPASPPPTEAFPSSTPAPTTAATTRPIQSGTVYTGGGETWPDEPSSLPPAIGERPVPPTVPPPSRGEDHWEYAPLGGMYAAAPLPLSPWEVLGWLLVVIVPVAGLLVMGVLAYRHIALTRAQIRRLGPSAGLRPGSGERSGQDPELAGAIHREWAARPEEATLLDEEADLMAAWEAERTLPIEEYLGVYKEEGKSLPDH